MVLKMTEIVVWGLTGIVRYRRKMGCTCYYSIGGAGGDGYGGGGGGGYDGWLQGKGWRGREVAINGEYSG